MTATENSFRCIPIVMTKRRAYETHDSDGWYYKGRYKNDKLVYRETYRSDGSLSSTSEWTDDGGFIQNNYDKNGELIK